MQLLNASNGSSCIRLSAEIWAHFIDFEGVRYISSLSNSPDDDHAECVFTPDPGQPVDYVLTAENYLSVWRVVQLCDRDQSVITRTDGVKLHAIKLATEDTRPGLIRPLWSTPPPGPVWSVQLLPSLLPTQLSMLVCNEPGVIGYSAHWNMGIMSLHAYIAGEDVTFYNGHEGGVWVYFPLQEGEKISEIWKCTQPRQQATLIFTTTHSRVTIFGPQPQARSTTQLTLVDLPYQNRGSRLFFEHSPLGIRNLAFETLEPAPRSDAIVLAQTLPRHPKAAFFESYFYSTAILKGVNEIVPCQRYVRSRLHITGLLLKFPKGQQSCVAEWHVGLVVFFAAVSSVFPGQIKSATRALIQGDRRTNVEPIIRTKYPRCLLPHEAFHGPSQRLYERRALLYDECPGLWNLQLADELLGKCRDDRIPRKCGLTELRKPDGVHPVGRHPRSVMVRELAEVEQHGPARLRQVGPSGHVKGGST
ncbi:hypothetical protein K456DRAFT_1914806 [Colletotrichum gloeosporioides 23]|nr:hypothetical protein K456DRAFT_1914806 [Colletotrichum gloeosporioides 23]